MASEFNVNQVLLEWINSFSLGKTIRTTEELSDGTIIWEILQDIDPQYFLDEIPEQSPSDHWMSRWQNLKHIHKLLVNYIKQQPDGLPSGLDPEPNLQLFAEKNSIREANKLLKLILIAAIRSPNAQTYVETLQTLSTPTQEGLKIIFEEAQDGELEPLDRDDEAHVDRDIAMDPELKFEERMGNLLAHNNRLLQEKSEMQKQIDAMNVHLVDIQAYNATLQDRLANTEERLISLKSGNGDILGLDAKGLDSRARQEEVIATLEMKLSNAQEDNDSLRMTVETLRVKTDRFQKLQDDYDELKTERDQLSRKANAAEKYRQKLQANQDFEKENQLLKNQIKDLKEQLKEADAQQKWTAERDKELEEYRIVMPQLEQDRSEVHNRNKQLEFNNHALTERLHNVEEQLERAESIISELRERLREYEVSPDSPSLTPGTETSNLQKDFEALGLRGSTLKSEIDDSRKEAESFKGQLPSGTFPNYGNFSDSFNETLKATKAGSSQGDAYWRLYDQYMACQQWSAQIQDKLTEARMKLEETTQVLEQSRADVSLNEEEKLRLINEVKDSCREEMENMREELRQTKEKISDLEIENNSSQVLTQVMITERDNLREMLEEREAKISSEDRETAERMRKLLAELTGRENADESQTSDLIKEVIEQMEKNIERLAQRAEYIHQQAEHIKLLQDRITQLEEQQEETNDIGEDVISKERELELQKQIEALTRELSLIASSWYELQSKLHNTTNVPISRYRHGSASLADAQKGWLARQRSAVAGR